MSALVTAPLLVASLYGARYAGLDRTMRALAAAGALRRRTRLRRARSAGELHASVRRGYAHLPLPIQCLEQAMVTWCLLNAHGHAATLKIGALLSPLESHAWVELVGDGTVFGDTPHRRDMHVVAEYPPF